MASSHQEGSASGANATPNSQQQNSSDSETIHVATANAVQDQATDSTQALPPNTTTAPQAPPPPAVPPAQVPTAPAPPAHHRGLRGARWYIDEIMFVFTLLAEEPTMPWREITPRLNQHFSNRPIRVGGRLEPRANRSSQAVRLHFRQLRRPLQDRLDAQRGVGDQLVPEGDQEGEQEDEEEIQDLAQILLDAVDGVKYRKEDSDDEGAGGNDDLPGGGAPIAV